MVNSIFIIIPKLSVDGYKLCQTIIAAVFTKKIGMPKLTILILKIEPVYYVDLCEKMLDEWQTV